MPNTTIEEGDVVVLWTSDNRSRTCRVLSNEFHQTHLGDLSFRSLVGREFGCRFELIKGWGLALSPAMEDRVRMVRRSTNILFPKDIGLILMKLVLAPGSSVIELGTGSGAMTTALANAVSPGGVVYSFDIREDHLSAARKNIRRTGIDGDIRLALREVKQPLDVEPVQSVMMDIPEPWEELDTIEPVLAKGGRLAAGVPTYNQVEKTATAMKERGYLLIECIETIFRRVIAVEGRVRPSRSAVPHTEFLLFGVKSGESIPEGIDQFYPER